MPKNTLYDADEKPCDAHTNATPHLSPRHVICHQVRRKEQLEGELKQLESDIERLSRAGSLLIRN